MSTNFAINAIITQLYETTHTRSCGFVSFFLTAIADDKNSRKDCWWIVDHLKVLMLECSWLLHSFTNWTRDCIRILLVTNKLTLYLASKSDVTIRPENWRLAVTFLPIFRHPHHNKTQRPAKHQQVLVSSLSTQQPPVRKVCLSFLVPGPVTPAQQPRLVTASPGAVLPDLTRRNIYNIYTEYLHNIYTQYLPSGKSEHQKSRRAGEG